MYFCTLMQKIQSNDAVNFKTSQKFQNLLLENVEYNISSKEFDFGVFIIYRNQNGTFNTGKCQDQNLNTLNANQVGMQCPQNFKFQLAGNTATLVEKFISADIIYCDQTTLNKRFQGKKCKSKTQTDSILKNMIVVIAQKQQYFDVDEFRDSPIKDTIKISTLDLIPNFTQNYDYKLSENEAYVSDTLTDSFFEGKKQNYYKSRLESTSVSSLQTTTLARIRFLLDENVESVERITDTIIDAISQVGGLMSIIFSIISFFVCYIQDFLFNSHIIRKIFAYNDRLFKQEYVKQSNKKLKKYSIEQNQNVKTDNTLENSHQTIKKQDIFNNQPEQKNKILQYQKIILQGFLGLKEFKYSILDKLQYLISRIICCLITRRALQRIRMKESLFQKGIKKLDEKFDIENLIRVMSKLKELEIILLNQQQRNIFGSIKKILKIDVKSKNPLAIQSHIKNQSMSQSQMIQNNIQKFKILDKIDMRMAKRFLKKTQINNENKDMDANFIDYSAFDFNQGKIESQPVAEGYKFQQSSQNINESQRHLTSKGVVIDDDHDIILDV
ncbi:UNKNOWN [Stylonychia lemnae]|uniref:Transmembrane protein n=1 Tax=Stylonychia lemnae TaxID=5949 RepID=A0A078B7E2_STYLE|nr:UNKNOWN [Stylonychia lemnae]|eukprot:CDW90405.1 UNKNOWN [Stylonychia lemnae]